MFCRGNHCNANFRVSKQIYTIPTVLYSLADSIVEIFFLWYLVMILLLLRRFQAFPSCNSANQSRKMLSWTIKHMFKNRIHCLNHCWMCGLCCVMFFSYIATPQRELTKGSPKRIGEFVKVQLAAVCPIHPQHSLTKWNGSSLQGGYLHCSAGTVIHTHSISWHSRQANTETLSLERGRLIQRCSVF